MNIAIVTGASSGIGKAFVKRLDKIGLDEIWGIALKKNLLAKTAEEIKTPFREFAVDLTKNGVDVLTDALKQNSPNVRWLVNAGGFGKFGRYDEIPLCETLNMIRLNCESLVAVTEIVLPYMKENAKIAQLGSVAGFQPTPYLNVYAATKAFVYSYSLALNDELKSRKITVCAVCPYWTKTAFFDRAERTNKNVVTNYAVMYSADDVVKKAYGDIIKKRNVSIYGFVARSQVRLVKILPAKLTISAWNKLQKFDKRYT